MTMNKLKPTVLLTLAVLLATAPAWPLGGGPHGGTPPSAKPEQVAARGGQIGIVPPTLAGTTLNMPAPAPPPRVVE